MDPDTALSDNHAQQRSVVVRCHHAHRITVLLCLIAFSILSLRCIASPPAIPTHALAYYRLDPTDFQSNAAPFLPIMLRLAEDQGLIDSEFYPVFDGILAAGTAGAVPDTLCLLDLDAEYNSPAKNGFRINTLKAVLILETKEGHHGFLKTLGTIVSHYDQNKNGDTPQPFTLPNGQKGVRYRADHWEEWQVLEWASLSATNNGFIVGFGHGSIEQWVNTQHRPPDQEFIDQHRRAVPDGPSESFIEVYLNLDQCRTLMPELVAQGILRDLLVTWKLDNARDWMLHGQRSGKYLATDLTWRRRSDPTDHIAHRSATLGHWPSDLTMSQPPGEYLVVIPIDFDPAFDRLLDFSMAVSGSDPSSSLTRNIKRYQVRKRTTFEPMWSAFQPYLVLSDYPAPTIPIPCATTVYAEIKPSASERMTQSRFEALCKQFFPMSTVSRPTDESKSPDGTVIRYDRKERLYSLQYKQLEWLRFPCWGWADRNFILSWEPNAVIENRRLLSDR